MKQPAIPWCEQRRQYCASACSIGGLSGSGLCDWQNRLAAAVPGRQDELPEERQPAQLAQERRGGSYLRRTHAGQGGRRNASGAAPKSRRS